MEEGEGNDIMQNKNDAAEGKEGNDIMQNQSVETDNSANKGEASDNMQSSSDADAENDANYLKQIEKGTKK